MRHSIGINDRFLLIRDLFGGKAEEYERVIDELDAFTELDDAMIYIQENFEWNPDCDGATLLVELLERKLDPFANIFDHFALGCLVLAQIKATAHEAAEAAPRGRGRGVGLSPASS